jgi:hypothetical protein
LDGGLLMCSARWFDGIREERGVIHTFPVER